MADEQKTVFISYRRSVSGFTARAIFMDLRANGYDVFMDVESIDSGQFDRIILNQIEARAHFLIILAPGSVERCANPDDWLRREIEYAIDKDRNIVPLTVSGFTFAGTEPYLTGKLAELSRFNGLNIPLDYFDEAMNRLHIRFLKQPVYGVVKPAPASDQPVVWRKIAEVASQPSPTEQQLSAEDYFNRAYQKEKSDLDGAIEDYSEAIRLNPQDDVAYYNRGNMLHTKGDNDGAIADYTKALRLNPQFAAAYLNRGNARQDTGDLDGAIADYNEALRLNPQDDETYNNRGLVRRDKGDNDGAIADYNAAIRLNPQSAEAYTNRGNVYTEKGNIDGAIADYSEAIRFNPQSVVAYCNRAIVRKAKGDLDGTIADYSEAIRLDPQNDYAYYNRGAARQSKGDLKGAILDLQIYLDLGGGKQYGDQALIEQIIRDMQAYLNKR